MKTVFALVLALAGLFFVTGKSEATGAAVFVNRAGFVVAARPVVQTVVVRRGLFGFRRTVIVNRAVVAPKFVVDAFGNVIRVR